MNGQIVKKRDFRDRGKWVWDICHKISTKPIKNMMKSLMFLDVDYHL